MAMGNNKLDITPYSSEPETVISALQSDGHAGYRYQKHRNALRNKVQIKLKRKKARVHGLSSLTSLKVLGNFLS